MGSVGVRSPEVLDELEAHVREEVERQSKSGVGVEHAFHIALHKLGNADTLQNEFRKTSRASATERLMIGICGCLVGFSVVLSGLAVFLCFESWGERAMATTAVACIFLVACTWGYGVPFLPRITSTRARWMTGLSCIACGFVASSVFCQFILPRFEVSPDRQLPAIGLWAVFLIAIFACTGLGLIMSEREREIRGMRRSRPKNAPAS